MLDTRRSWLVGELSVDDSGVERWRSLRKLEAARIAARRGAGHAEGAWGVEEWPRIDLFIVCCVSLRGCRRAGEYGTNNRRRSAP
jgi:hypothetical protein